MMYGDERILQNGLKFTECYTNNLLFYDLPGWGRQYLLRQAQRVLNCYANKRILLIYYHSIILPRMRMSISYKTTETNTGSYKGD